MKQIIILTTGGTIAMRADANTNGAIPTLVGADLVQGLPTGLADVRVEAFSNLPSAHFTLDHLWNLSRRITALVEDENVDGVVVTHGTDTFDESVYLSDLTIQTPKPIVFTGAMRTASEAGYDGLANLAAAIQVAASDAARDLGVLAVFNDEIHGARDVMKSHTTALATFASPEFGMLGRVYPDGVFIARKLMQHEFVPATHLEKNAHLLTLAVGISDALLEYLYDTVGARGVVLETLGGGRVPPGWLPTIERAIKAGTAIVITSRVSMGRTIDRYGYVGAHRDLANLGCWFADGLSGPKARIKLMATLATNEPQKFWRVE